MFLLGFVGGFVCLFVFFKLLYLFLNVLALGQNVFIFVKIIHPPCLEMKSCQKIGEDEAL